MTLDSNKNIGNAGLSVAIAYFGANGHAVSIPLTDTQEYDLVVELDGELKRVQVKATNFKRTCGTYTLSLQTSAGIPRRVVKTVKDTNVDLLFCLCGDGSTYLIPREDIASRTTLSLGPETGKYAKYRVQI